MSSARCRRPQSDYTPSNEIIIVIGYVVFYHIGMKRILLLRTWEATLDSDIRYGIADYASKNEPWSFYEVSERSWDRPSVASIEEWDGDGMIGPIYKPADIAAVKRLGIPAVNTSARASPSCVNLDDAAVGRVGAAHLIDRGFRHMAFASVINTAYADVRAAGFVAEARARGIEPIVYPGDHGPGPRWTWHTIAGDFARWIADLPTPIGIMACHDTRARHVLAGCELAGRSVPDEVAVLGAGNNAPVCLLGSPTISSVDFDAFRVGYQAAKLLDRLMRGETAPQTPTKLTPLGVVPRQSTDTLAFDDPMIGRALRFIRTQPTRALSVEDVVSAVHTSRPTLERKFRLRVGHSPFQEVRRVQIEHVKRLLIETDWDIKQVAVASAFRDPIRLGIVFKKETGQTPTAFRAENRTQ